MKRELLGLLACIAAAPAHGGSPSKAAIYSCLSAYAVSPSVTWQDLPTNEIYSQNDYKDGFDATYYIIATGTEIGYAEKGEAKAILYDRELFPVARARRLHGFGTRPSELNPRMAEWGTVADKSGRFLCVSFPFGALGQSGSFQKYRSAYLMSLGRGAHILYSATGNIDAFKH
jgi:hypothetical protein